MRPLNSGERASSWLASVPEATNSADALYGNLRLQQRLLSLQQAQATPRQVVQTLRADVLGFVAGAEAADDLTILAVRWYGPAGAAP